MIRLTRGDSADWNFQRKSCDGSVITEVPAEITFTVRITPEGAAILQRKLSDGGIIFNEDDSTYHVIISPTDSAKLEPEVYGYDVEVADGDYVRTIALDKLTIIADYTHSTEEQ